ncbi:MAG: DUF4199 domain-containing protein [Bacteroidetes bacterium]|nr:DUF4199 domain-containing protein [Bacteroidota bacterium]MCK6611388.1 DUF4199 domain-containing protein [Bacteroidia bacterium]
MDIEHKTTKGQVVIKFAIIYALVSIGISLVFYIMDINQSGWLAALPSLVLTTAILFFGLNSRKNDTLGGYMSYSQGLGTGMLIVLAGSLVASLYQYVFLTFIDPEFVEKALNLAKEEMLKKEMSEDQIEQAISMSRKMMKPWVMSLIGLFGSLFFGLIINLILAAVTKKEDPNRFYSNLQS